MTALLNDSQVVQRVFEHIDNKTTDMGNETWREPVGNYRSERRFAAELDLLRRLPIPFCPSVALPDAGSFVARNAAGTPIVVVRGEDGEVRGFRNACRHRGMRLVEGTGCVRALTCGYHAWSYRLDGRLQHIPHGQGFPDVDKAMHGLVPVHAIERSGLIYVNQSAPASDRDVMDTGLTGIPDLIASDQNILTTHESMTDVNWKLFMEANLEGYHIKPTHPESFYPYGFDNLTLVERFGRNSRVTFPFRRIEKLRPLAPEKRRIAGMVTYVYHLFPNVVIAVLSNHTTMTVLEPLSPTQTRFHNWRLTNQGDANHPDSAARATRDAAFVGDTGGKEDAAVIRAIQNGLTSGANAHFTYGLFEAAIVHFHKTLHGLLGEVQESGELSPPGR